jgi:hypothetical protein
VVVEPTDLNENGTTVEDTKGTSNYDTIDALPHIDHYRNIFSITSSESKLRPTLEALHETPNARLGSTMDLNSEMISTLILPTDQSSSPVEIKPKVEVVKFGWIIGVLVC